MTRSLQFKLTLTMLLTSLASVALVGIIARESIGQKFDQISMDQSLGQFRDDLQAYFSTYGNWEKAQKILPFEEFSRRRSMPAKGPNSPQIPSASDQNSPRAASGEVESPFRFIVLDASGKVLLGPPEMRNIIAPTDLRTQGEPVVVNGRTAAFVVPVGHAVYTEADVQYISAVRDALIRGMLCAALLALALGLYFGNKLSQKLHELSTAIEAMGEGDLRQQVNITSDDEIGVLASNFNRMSAELAQTHEKLQQSHDKISHQAALLKDLSVRDGLTNLYNRRFFDERGPQLIAQAARYERPFTIMMGDIDYFKKINDQYSHALGDEVLRRIAALLQQNTRDSDVVARYGGEEFVIVFPETPLHQAAALCERLRQEIEEHPWHEVAPDVAPGLSVTMSMGLSDDLSLETFEKLVAAADAMLYEAKAKGRNRLCLPV